MSLHRKKFTLFAICILVSLLMTYRKILTTDKLDEPTIIIRSNDELLELSRYVLVDALKHGSSVSESKQGAILGANLPSLPYEAWKANKDDRWHLKCGQYPYIFDVTFYNTYWQTAKLKNYTLQIYGTYYDDRPIFDGKAYVRLYAYINAYMPNLNGLQGNQSESIPAYCQLWFDSQPEPVVVNVTNLRYTWLDYWGVDRSGGYEGHLLTCEIPSSHRNSTPSSVTLVEQACEKGTNHLKVMNERPASNETKTDFGICVRNAVFPFEDKSIRYIEWIELQLAMGVSQIYFYVMDVHPNIEKVLKYYEARGKIRVSYMTYPSGSPNVHGLPLEYQRQNAQTRKWELISLNDCYYRNMHKHKFLAMLDPDEVIMPKSYFRSFYELFDAVEHDFAVKRDNVNSFNFMNSYFLHEADHKPTKDIPGFLYMMQHVDRLQEYSQVGNFIKSFHNTANCLVVHNHYPMKCVSPWKEEWCTDYMINTTYAQLNHYRESCIRYDNKCDVNTTLKVKDTHAWKYKNLVIPKAVRTMKDLGMIKKTGK